MMRLQEQVARRSELAGEIKRNLAGGMSAEPLFVLSAPWEVATLGDVCRRGGGTVQTGPFGSQLHASDYVPVGIPSIMPMNIGDNRISEEGIARITPDDAKRLSKYLVKTGDIVYSRRGDVERRSLIRDHENGWLCGTGCLRVSFGEKRVVHPPYAAYYLGHPLVREWIVRHAQGATMPNLNTSILSALPFVLPPFEEQERIAGILADLDDKIENNRQINQTLEQIAQTIFKSWFVDFEPVKAKIEAKATGRDPERGAMCAISGKLEPELDQLPPEQYQQLAATAALFPDALVESELGLIPEGWEVVALYDTAGYVNGSAFKAVDFSEEGCGLPVVKIAELKQGITSQTKFTVKKFQDKYAIDSGDMLYSWSGSPETSLDVFKWFGGGGWLNQHIFKLNFSSKEQRYFAFYLLRHLKPILVQTAMDKQTTGLGHVTVADMKRIKVAHPDKESLKAYCDTVEPLYELDSQMCQQTITFATLRDTLLPKLLSGELTIENLPLEATA